MGDPEVIETMRDASRRRFKRALTWPIVLAAYEKLLNRYCPHAQSMMDTYEPSRK
jgi:hypothetical protein